MLYLFIYSLIGGLFSLLGGLLLIWKPDWTYRIMHILISFGAGAFLGAVFLDILPEALEMSGDPHTVMLSALIGFVSFFLIERLVMSYKHHDAQIKHGSHTEMLSLLVILGDSIHNFLDGVVIALAYLANPVLALPTALAVAAHEIPQEIADFSILLRLKWKPARVVAINILQSLATIPGVVLGLTLGSVFQAYLPSLMGMTAGIFIYISASALVPELHHISEHKNFLKTVIPFLVSIILMYLLLSLVHHN